MFSICTQGLSPYELVKRRVTDYYISVTIRHHGILNKQLTVKVPGLLEIKGTVWFKDLTPLENVPNGRKTTQDEKDSITVVLLPSDVNFMK